MPIKIIRTSDMRGSKHKNTRRENRLEELGRVDAEKARTSRGKRNLREEKDRIRSELATGGKARKGHTPDRRPKQSPDLRRRREQGPKKFGREKGIPKTQRPKDMYDNFMDQYKKHKRDKFRKDLQEKIYPKDRKPGDPPRILEPRLPRPKKDRIMTPLRVKKRNGGSAAEHYLQHGYGPHKSSGKVLKGKKIGIQIK